MSKKKRWSRRREMLKVKSRDGKYSHEYFRMHTIEIWHGPKTILIASEFVLGPWKEIIYSSHTSVLWALCTNKSLHSAQCAFAECLCACVKTIHVKKKKKWNDFWVHLFLHWSILYTRIIRQKLFCSFSIFMHLAMPFFHIDIIPYDFCLRMYFENIS